MILKFARTFMAFCALWLLSSSVSFAADPFTVSGVFVEAEGESAISAQTEAISAGQLQAANLLIERLTLPADRAANGFAGLDIQTAAKLIRGMEIANEKRSANRYLGDITVAFNPPSVQAFLAAQNMTMISTQARMRLVLPVLDGSDLWQSNDWQEAWRNARYSHALTPMQGVQEGQGNNNVITARQAANVDMGALQAIGSLYGVNQILIAQARGGLGGLSVQLKDVALDSGRVTDMGVLDAYEFEEAVVRIVSQVENEWKASAVNTAENAVTINVSVLYRSHADWQRLQSAINNSAQITDARLDALSKDGSLMTITYGGDLGRLANELSFKGVSLENSEELGTVLSLASRR